MTQKNPLLSGVHEFCLLPMVAHQALIIEQNLKISCIFLYYKYRNRWEFQRRSGHWQSENQISVAGKNLSFKPHTKTIHLTTFISANTYKKEVPTT